MSLPRLVQAAVERCVDAALDEDLGGAGDLTTAAVIPAGATARASIVARSNLVVAGLPVAASVFERLDPGLRWEPRHDDGDEVSAGTVLATVRDAADPILRGERTALNFLMRMCGIATVTRSAVREIAHTGARILDTRKTAPGLRVLDKYAVAAGGAVNHRMGLFDAVMIKDTHVAVAGSVGAAVRAARAAGHAARTITAEVRTPFELREAIEAGAGRALLDNMDLGGLAACVREGKGRIVLEASGGLRPGSLAEVAATGVDFLSLGRLTHSVEAADVAMEIDIAEVESGPTA